MRRKAKFKPEPYYWFKYYHYECVICGKSTIEKEKVYGPKPKNHNERHVFRELACHRHFF